MTEREIIQKFLSRKRAGSPRLKSNGRDLYGNGAVIAEWVQSGIRVSLEGHRPEDERLKRLLVALALLHMRKSEELRRVLIPEPRKAS